MIATVAEVGTFICTAYTGLKGGVCFVTGTLVLTETGQEPIETIAEGEYVYATDPETGESGYKQVVQTYVNETNELVHVKTDGDEIVCTREHPFYVPVRGWTAACDLRAGDILVRSNGEYVVVEAIEHELLESPITVYNFEVEDFHTYHVGSASVLVHNKCSNGSVGKRNTPDQDALIQIAKEHKRGVSKEEANILVEWAEELGVKTHLPKTHPNRSGIWSYTLHIVIRNLHIRVFE